MALLLRALGRIACSLVCVVPLLAGAQAAGHAMDMGRMDMGPALGASAAFDSHGRLWLATTRAGHVWLQHSDDFGKTWSKPVAVNAVAEKIGAMGENRPQVALGEQGQIYVTWSHSLAKPWTSEVRFARSTDAGKTFSTPVKLSGEDPDASRGFASLAVAGNGNVVVAWIDDGSADTPNASGKSHRASLDYRWSNDSGKTFVPPRRVPRASCECCRIAMAREPDDDVAAFYRSVYGDNIRDHAFAKVDAEGKTDDPARATFSNWQIAACPEQGPGLAIGANGVRHAVWYEASHGPAVWYGQLDPGHPPRHKLRIGGSGASHADVAVSGSTVWVVWNQVDAKGYRLMLRTSRDDGDNFGAPRVIAESSVAAYSPQLLVHAGRAYAAWNTADGFRLITIPDATDTTP